MGSTCSVIPDVPERRDVALARASASSRVVMRDGGYGSTTHLNSVTSRQSATDRRLDLVGPQAGFGGSVSNRQRKSGLDGGGSASNPLNRSVEGGQRQLRSRSPQSTPNAQMLASDRDTDAQNRLRPKCSRPFSELLGHSLLLRYHPDRVTMFTRLRGGCVTPEGITISTIAERLAKRDEEYQRGRFIGDGHLYFLAVERPHPLPLNTIAPMDKRAAMLFAVQHLPPGVDDGHSTGMSENLAAMSLRELLERSRTELLRLVEALGPAVDALDYDSATALCQRILLICKQLSLNRILAIAMQVFLCMNDILVIEHIGSTFEEAVRAYLAHPADQSSGAQNQEVPDLTTVLELYTLLIGGYNSQDDAQQQQQQQQQLLSVVSMEGRSSVGSISVDVPSNASRNAAKQCHASPPPAHSSDEAVRESSQGKFHPTLFAPFNFSGSETVVAQARAKINSASGTGGLRQSGHTTVTGGALSTGSFLLQNDFQLPKVIQGADSSTNELQLQLINQVHVLLEVQEMLHETLSYLIHVAQYHVQSEFPTC